MDPAKSRRRENSAAPPGTANTPLQGASGNKDESSSTHRLRRGATPSKQQAEETESAPARFFCPVCKRWRPYQIKRARKLLPRALRTSGESGDEVECQLCSRAFPLSALDYDPKAAKQEKNERRERFTDGLQQAMAAMVMIDGRLTFKEVEAMRAVVQQATGQACDNDQLDAMLRSVRGRLDEVIEHLRDSREQLSEKRRKNILLAVVHVAAASGEIDDSQRMLARRVGEALGLGPRMVREAIDAASQPESGDE